MTEEPQLRRNEATILVCFVLGSILTLSNADSYAHNLSPGAPDWCEGSDQQTPNTLDDYKPSPGDWPGPADNKGTSPRTEHGAITLGTEFPGFSGRNLRARYGELAPGGHIQYHCHDDRPVAILMLSGSVVETTVVDGEKKIIVHNAGDIIAEGNGIRHWWINLSEKVPVKMVTVDLANVDRRPMLGDAGEWEEGAWFNLADEFPHLEGLRGIEALSGTISLQPGDVTKISNHKGQPRFAYVIKGTVTEFRSDSVEEIVHGMDSSSLASGAIWSYFLNHGDKPAELFVYKFSNCDGECRPSGDNAPRREYQPRK